MIRYGTCRNADGELKIGFGRAYSMDSYATGLNNHVMAVGASGSGKTSGLVIPNLLACRGSYVVCDPKGRLYTEYGEYLRQKGYRVCRFSLDPEHKGEGYNPFRYIHSEQDILRMSHMLANSEEKKSRNHDPFWKEAAELVISAMIAYVVKYRRQDRQNLHMVHSLLSGFQLDQDSADYTEDNREDRSTQELFAKVALTDRNGFCYQQYEKFNTASQKTMRSVLMMALSELGAMDTDDINQILQEDTIGLERLGREKTALFVEVSDTDRSLDRLYQLFFTQAMQALCEEADKKPDCRLEIPVQFILDDFATNVVISDFPRMIASIRSRGISVMLMLQAESQLMQCYGRDGRTIIGNCDTYVYLGGNDLETAEQIARRANVRLKDILEMPIGDIWIFRRGERPVQDRLVGIYQREQILEQRVQYEGVDWEDDKWQIS